MLRDYLFKKTIKRVYKQCDKYKECIGCPFARPTQDEEGEDYNECNLTNWENGSDRYPYEYKNLLAELEGDKK